MCESHGITNNVIHSDVAPRRAGADGAVGVSIENRHWYVAVVNSRHEKAVAEKLSALGYDTLVAVQKEMRMWANGRRKLIDRVVIPCTVFVKCTEKERRAIVQLPYINRFMVNRTADSGTLNKPAATIPDVQIRRLQFMLGQSETPVNFIPTAFKMNDNVRVIRGHLQGLEGVISRNPDGTHTLTVSLALLGGATVLISPHDVERM